MKTKIRFRRWLFGKKRRNQIVKFIAEQCKKNLSHYNNEDRNHVRNGEFWLQKTLVRHFDGLNKTPIIFDIGANVGDWSFHLLELNTKIMLHCFEPSKETFNLLSEKLQPFKNVVINNFGFSSESQVVDFYENDASDVTSLYKRFNAQNSRKMEVNLLKGDDYINSKNIKRIDFLKIDIEGMEYEALLGFLLNIQNKKIQMIQFEYGEFNIHSEKMLKHFYELLDGYKIGKLFPQHIEFQDWHLELENFKAANFIAINKKNRALLKLLDVE